MNVYPLVPNNLVQETLDVLGTSRLTERKVPLLTQLVIAVASGVPQPPSVPPVLVVSADLGSTTANLEWTPSNRTNSPGFSYRVEREIFSVFNPIGTTTDLYYNDDQPAAAGETYTYRITPFNDAGEGPSSNAASIVLPGESEAPVLTGPTLVAAGSGALLQWTDVPGAQLYRVERGTDGSTWENLTSTAALEYEVFPGAYTWFRVVPYITTPIVFEGLPSNALNINVYYPSSWILYTGFWDDSGMWLDDSTWTD